MPKHLPLIFLLLLLLMLPGCSSRPAPSPAPESSAPAAKKSSAIEICTDNYPPFQYEENGEIKGMAIDIAKEVFARMGREVRFRLYPWARALDMVRRGDADAIFLIFKTAERESYIQFPAEPFLLETQSLFVKTESTIEYNGDPASLAPYVIGTVKGYDFGSPFNTAAASHKLKIEPNFTNMENIDKLMNNRIDILLDSKYVTRYNLQKRGLTAHVRMLNPPVHEDYLYLGFSRARNLSPQFVAAYEAALRAVKADGTYDKIMSKYL